MSAVSRARQAARICEVSGCTLVVPDVDPLICVTGDRELLLAALVNLIQNAFKFTKPHTTVTLNAHAEGDRVLVDVRDNCGGLPSGAVGMMFKPFMQSGNNRNGLGLGLSIAKRSVEASGGDLRVRDLPGAEPGASSRSSLRVRRRVASGEARPSGEGVRTATQRCQRLLPAGPLRAGGAATFDAKVTVRLGFTCPAPDTSPGGGDPSAVKSDSCCGSELTGSVRGDLGRIIIMWLAPGVMRQPGWMPHASTLVACAVRGVCSATHAPRASDRRAAVGSRPSCAPAQTAPRRATSVGT